MRGRVKKDAENFRLRTGKEWVNSQLVTNCAECNEKFTVLKRKHHCRQCGLVICSKCSPERIIINDVSVRICQSCSDDVSVRGFPSNSISSNDYITLCIICQQSNTDKINNNLIEGRINGHELIYWHSSCMKCEHCSNILKLNEAYTFPPSINKTGFKPYFYCEEHIPKIDHYLDNHNNQNHPPSPLSTPSTPTEKMKQQNQQPQSQSSSLTNDNSIPITISLTNITNTNTTNQTKSSTLKIFEPLHFIYGKSPKTQYYLLHIPQENIDKIPTTDHRSVPLIVILHGGFWKSKYSVSNSCLDNLPNFFMSLGIAVCIIEYRRVKAENKIDEGGWPETGEDILNALNHLHNECNKLNLEILQETNNYNPHLNTSTNNTTNNTTHTNNNNQNLTRRALIDTNRIVLLGHSAGGQLALWCCCEPQLSKLPFKPLMCVAIAPVANMIEAYRLRLSDEGDAVENFMKMPFDSSSEESIKLYYSACPTKLLPLLIPTILVTGTSDTDVPSHLIEDFYWYAKRISGEILTKCISYQNSQLNNISDNNIGGSGDNNISLQNSINHSLTLDLKSLESRIDSFIVLHHQSILKSYQPSPPALKLLSLSGSTHYDVMDSTSTAWNSIYEEIMLMSPQLGDIPDLNIQLYQDYLNEVDLIKTIESTNSTLEGSATTTTTSTNLVNISSIEIDSSEILSNSSAFNTSESNNIITRSESDTSSSVRQISTHIPTQSQNQSSLPISPILTLIANGCTPVKASDIIWIIDNNKKYSDHQSEKLSDSSSDDISINNNHNYNNHNNNTSKGINEDRDTMGSEQQLQSTPPNELFSFPTPKSERSSKKGFGFRFLNQDGDES